MIMKPILFNTEMTKAILDGRKTVTRRVIPKKVVDAYYDYDDWCNAVMPRDISCTRTYEKQYFMDRARCAVGDILYVRETWCEVPYESDTIPIKGGHVTMPKYAYKATSKIDYSGIWRPSIHMPKEAARIFLKVTNVKVERLQEITEEDALKEGCMPIILDDAIFFSAKGKFHALWDSIYAKRGYGWEVNPWVWVIEFERISKEEAEKE
jgi:hypothetical protein